jgi:prepilin-type N-terminal cleavage/methylation domain-containing protein
MRLHKEKAGFTIIELMISTIVFSIILLGATTAVIQIGRMYYKGLVVSQTQETARRVIDDISREIQFSDKRIVRPAPVQYSISGGQITVNVFCVGTTRYSYVLGLQVNNDNNLSEHRLRHTLWQDEVDNPDVCATDPAILPGDPYNAPDLSQARPTANGKELIGRFMRLTDLTVNDTTDPNALSITVIYGDDDVLQPDGNNPVSCRGAVEGAQWCAVSSLATQVRPRISPTSP